MQLIPTEKGVIIITTNKYKHIAKGNIRTGFIHDKELGFFQSCLFLKKQGYNPNDFISEEIAQANPKLFTKVNTTTK